MSRAAKAGVAVRARIRHLVLGGSLRIDPYLVWAFVTRLRGVVSPKDPRRPWQVAAKLRAGTPEPVRKALRDRGFNLDPAATTILHTTGQLTDDDFEEALRSAHIERLELCRPLDEDSVAVMWAAPIPAPYPKLSGLVIAVIDDACAFVHSAFRWRTTDHRWRSRIAYLWDQGGPNIPAPCWRVPEDFKYGVEIGLRTTHPEASAGDAGPDPTGNPIDDLMRKHEQIDGSVDEDSCYADARYSHHVAASTTHGTHVLDIAAGKTNPLRLPGVSGPDDAAGHASIIFVQLPRSTVRDTSGESMAFYVIDALRYVLNRVEANAQVVVNLSYGSFASGHDGASILESAMDEVLSQRPDFAIVLPAGNSYESNCHAHAELSAATPTTVLHLQIRADDPSDTFVELWWPELDAVGRPITLGITIQPPGSAPASGRADTGESRLWNGKERWGPLLETPGFEPACALIRLPVNASSENPRAMALLALAPTRQGKRPRQLSPHGIWKIQIERVSGSDDVVVDAWIERDDQALGSARSRSQAFFCDERGYTPDPAVAPIDRRGTLSNIACGVETVVVGGCLLDGSELAKYSAAGPGQASRRPNGPDVVAPSDESATLRGLLAAGTRSGTSVRMDGTSVAAPVVARRLSNMLAGRADAGEAPVTASELKRLLLAEARPGLPAMPADADLVLRRGAGYVAPAP